MDRKLEVEIRMLRSDIDELRSRLHSIEDSIDQTYNSVSKLNTMWEGPSKVVFVKRIMQDQDDMKDICVDISKFLQNMESAVREYEQSEQMVQEIVTAIRV